MTIKYICPLWGSDELSIESFIEKAKNAGYDGVELNIAFDDEFVERLQTTLTKYGMVLVAQQWMPPADESFEAYKATFTHYLKHLSKQNPVFINSHTGKDFFSFEENSELLEACESIEKDSGVSIVHETHRGRFNFHAASTVPFIKRFPELKLNADFSHFTSVSESLLEDQEHILAEIMPRCQYIHARIGSDQSAQVNDPFAPEWSHNLNRFTEWWKTILQFAKDRGDETFYICPEFGPFPYIQELPYTKQATVNQWDINVKMMNYLQETL